MKSKNGKKIGYIVVNMRYTKEGEQFLGECVELGTATYGDTLDEVVNELRDLVTLHLASLEEANEAETFFKENDIEFRELSAQPKKRMVMVGNGNIPTILPVNGYHVHSKRTAKQISSPHKRKANFATT